MNTIKTVVVVTPLELATRTDLPKEQVRAIAAAVNPIIADSFALYLKTKNFHWHASGIHFRDFHLLFDEQAESIFTPIDALAERIRKLGESTIKSLGHAMKLTQIESDDDEYVPTQEMLSRLLADNLAVAKSQRAAIDFCEQNGDKVTANLLQEVLDGTERRIWFLFESSQNS